MPPTPHTADSRKNGGPSMWFRKTALPFAISQVASGMRLVMILQQTAAVSGSPSGFFAALHEAVRVRGGWRGFLVTFAVYRAFNEVEKRVQVSPVFGFSASVSLYLRLVLIHPLQVLTIVWVVHGRNSLGHTVSHLASRSAVDWLAGLQYSLLGTLAYRFVYFRLYTALEPKVAHNSILSILVSLLTPQVAGWATYPLSTAARRSVATPDCAPWSVGPWLVGYGTHLVGAILGAAAMAM